MNTVDWCKSESDVGKTSYSTVGEKETWIGTVDPIIAAENSQSAKNVAKVADTTLSEGFSSFIQIRQRYLRFLCLVRLKDMKHESLPPVHH